MAKHRMTHAQRQDWTTAILCLREVGDPFVARCTGDGPVFLGDELGKFPRIGVFWRDGSTAIKIASDYKNWRKSLVRALKVQGFDNPRGERMLRIVGRATQIAGLVVGGVMIATGVGAAAGMAVITGSAAAGQALVKAGSGEGTNGAEADLAVDALAVYANIRAGMSEETATKPAVVAADKIAAAANAALDNGTEDSTVSEVDYSGGLFADADATPAGRIVKTFAPHIGRLGWPAVRSYLDKDLFSDMSKTARIEILSACDGYVAATLPNAVNGPVQPV